MGQDDLFKKKTIYLLEVDNCYEESKDNAGEDDTEDRENRDEEPDGQKRNTKHY